MQIQWKSIDSFIGNSSATSLLMNRPCPICGTFFHARNLLRFDDLQFFTDSVQFPKRADISIVQCRQCFGIFQNPGFSPTAFEILFAEAGCSYGSSNIRPHEQVEWLASRGLLEGHRRILDVGCYKGEFLSILPDNHKRIGVDIDAGAVAAGNCEAAGTVEIFCGDFETFQLREPVDLITMFHVLEHLPRPVSVLRNLRAAASGPDARLVVEVPILEKGITNDINGFFSVLHMTHFSRQSLRNVLAAAGWCVVEADEKEDYNALRIVAAPGELAVSAMGSPDDLQGALESLSAWNSAVISVERMLSRIKEDRVVIWGGGMHLEFLYQVTSLFQRVLSRKYIIVDNDPLKQGKTWRGVNIYPSAILQKLDWSSDVSLIISSYGAQQSIAQASLDLKIPTHKTLKLYDMVTRC
ncbi:MAG: class I SAM-dependent methyltransferase [Geobacter sp.]|nr:class I SAM-dependent methyltransferase [Geobacter sp.]